MSDPVTPREIQDDLLYSNEVTEDYIYVRTGGALFIDHYSADGNRTGRQSLSFNIGKYIAEDGASSD